MKRIDVGHTIDDHGNGKRGIGETFCIWGCSLVVYEYRHCDVVGFRRIASRDLLLCSEYERSSRNALRNATRNLRMNPDHVFVICSDERVARQVSRILARELDEYDLKKIEVLPLKQFSVTVLDEWLESYLRKEELGVRPSEKRK